jgi:phosphatidylserine/phosphatidylglycerophosphate/cardiolipin synthase-like enzyme
MTRCILLAALLGLVVALVCAQTYDHQTQTYNANLPVYKATGASMTVTPIFSPLDPTAYLTAMIENAKTSVFISTPGFSSWSGCTNWNSQQCVGCNVTFQHSGEEFPVFRALLNAIHRGVSVRLLTNDYDTPPCANQIDPLTFLQLAGGSVRFYTTTTFTHLKFMAVDGEAVSISSINYSFSSFMENREAGMVVEGNADVTKYLISIVELDWDQAYDLKPAHAYSSDDMVIIQDKTYLNPNVPASRTFSCNVGSTPHQPVSDTMDIVAYASPDSAWEATFSLLNQTQKSLHVSIYQITDDSFCEMLIEKQKAGIQLYLFVSDHIFDKDDYASAQQCYEKLHSAGVMLKKADPKCLKFNHEKFWVIDEQTVVMSSGNWSPTDYPQGSMVFPPHTNSAWRKVNRDITLAITHPAIAKAFLDVFNTDFNDGWWYTG